MSGRSFHYYALTVLAVVAVNFFLPRFLPGSPIKHIAGEDTSHLTPEERDRVMESYNLTQPLARQFFIYNRDLVTLNWGNSFSRKMPISRVVLSALPWTLLLCGSALAIAIPLGCLLGAHSALVRKKRKGLKLILLNTIISSFPPFWVGMVLMSIFGIWLQLLPTFGGRSIWADLHGLEYAGDLLAHLLLPLTTMVLASIMPYFITMRQAVMGVMNEDYVIMAVIRRLPSSYINRKYIIRNALPPVFALMMLDFGYIFSGSAVIETVFAYPGLGRVMYEAVKARDYPLIQYSFLVSSILVICLAFLADFLHKFLDPRLRDGR
jgi:peptide/nickel transport system permease protein